MPFLRLPNWAFKVHSGFTGGVMRVFYSVDLSFRARVDQALVSPETGISFYKKNDDVRNVELYIESLIRIRRIIRLVTL